MQHDTLSVQQIAMVNEARELPPGMKSYSVEGSTSDMLADLCFLWLTWPQHGGNKHSFEFHRLLGALP